MSIKEDKYYEMECGEYAYQYSEYIPVCDLCGAVLRERHTWKDAHQELKDAGWRTFKDANGKWKNHCLKCGREE